MDIKDASILSRSQEDQALTSSKGGQRKNPNIVSKAYYVYVLVREKGTHLYLCKEQ